MRGPCVRGAGGVPHRYQVGSSDGPRTPGTRLIRGERSAFWLESTFDRKKASSPTTIVDDDDGAWLLIAPAAVLAIRPFDPTAATPPKRVGFVVPGGERN